MFKNVGSRLITACHSAQLKGKCVSAGRCVSQQAWHSCLLVEELSTWVLTLDYICVKAKLVKVSYARNLLGYMADFILHLKIKAVSHNVCKPKKR